MKMTLGQLKNQLDYPHIDEVRRLVKSGFLWWKRDDAYHEFRILPAQGAGPPVCLLFGVDEEDGYCLQHLAFGDWHDHFERHGDEQLNVDEALQMARRLITKELCLLVCRDDLGRYACGTIMSVKKAQEQAASDELKEVIVFDCR